MQTLLDLLQHLDAARPQSPATWRGWIITPITGGANNLLYRVSSEAGDYAVKFMLRDARDRAGREAAALQVLHQAGLQIAPRLVLLERDRKPGWRARSLAKPRKAMATGEPCSITTAPFTR